MGTYSVRPIMRKDALRKKDGKGQLYLQVGINSKQIRIKTGIYLLPEDWNQLKGIVRKSHPEHDALNIEIRDLVSDANKIFIQYRRDKIELTTEIFRQAFEHPSSRENFLEYMRVSIERRHESGQIGKTTRTKHRTIWKLLKGFQSRILFAEISQTLIDNFDLWYVRKLRKEYGSDLVSDGQGARSNAQKTIRVYLRLAAKDEISFKMPKFETRQVFEEAGYLREREVRRLMKMFKESDRYPEHWKEVLRTFLWMCFTGQSYTDAMDCSWEENIRDDTLRYIRNKQLKHRKVVLVPITPAASQYLPQTKVSGKVFHQMENQSFNRALKQIKKEADIKIKLTSKVARDTFGTLFCEAVGGDVFTLMEVMGHSKIETTRKYVHLSQGHKIKQVLKAFERFFPEI